MFFLTNCVLIILEYIAFVSFLHVPIMNIIFGVFTSTHITLMVQCYKLPIGLTYVQS